MRLPICPVCEQAWPLAAMQWSEGLPSWTVLPRERPGYEDTCQQLRPGAVTGSTWCPAMRQMLCPAPPSEPARSGDTRDMGDMRDIMGLFQSLGDNCELGLVQQAADQEPLDLLRFAGFNIPVEHRLRQTIKALTENFAGLGDPSSITCEPQGNNREYMISETRWNLLHHSGEHEGTIEPDALVLRQSQAFQFRRRKLLEDMATAHRVFVWKSNLAPSEAEIRELVACLRSHGPNLLLWVSLADQDHPAGSAEYAGGGLLKGYVSRFAPYHDATAIDFTSWNAMCRNAADQAHALRHAGEWSSPEPPGTTLTF